MGLDLIRSVDFKNLCCTQLIFLLVRLSLGETRKGKLLTLRRANAQRVSTSLSLAALSLSIVLNTNVQIYIWAGRAAQAQQKGNS